MGMQVLRTPKTRFTETDVAYWEAVLVREELEERVQVAVQKLRNIREHFRKALDNPVRRTQADAQE
jgi:hypothetical protein